MAWVDSDWVTIFGLTLAGLNLNHSKDTEENQALPPAARRNRDPPAFYLAELRVSHIDDQRQAGNPHAHLQLGAQETVGEVELHLTLSSCLLPIDVNIVAAFWHLDDKK